MIKATVPWNGPVADDLAYSLKVTGVRRTDRSIPRTTVEAERWIAPPDFIDQMAEGLDIRFDHQWDFLDDDAKVISTIPMPALMRALNYSSRPEFPSRSGVNISARIVHCDAYASLYVPNPSLPFSRVSITGDELIVECSDINHVNDTNADVTATIAARLLGIGEGNLYDIAVHDQAYAKILPIDEGARRTFIHWASTIKGRAFSLGRFATWRPGLLLDDLIHDVRVIESLMNSTSLAYDAEKIERERRRQ
jgi:hypothetical protein